jgi:hypothetical protein
MASSKKRKSGRGKAKGRKKVSKASRAKPATRAPRRASTGSSVSSARARRPTRLPARAALPRHDEEGVLGWLVPQMASSYAHLAVRGAPLPQDAPKMRLSTPTSVGLANLHPAVHTVWRDTLLEYKRRKAAARARPAAAAAPVAPVVPGGRNWLPLGPSVVLQGQTVGNQPVAGRVARLAIAPGGTIVYAASANGGVFRSDDGATTWRSLMDGFDLDPTSFASSSVICGAIAIDAADPNRVYVGSGEGDTLQLFRLRVVNALPAYRGVGMIRSDDGGKTWIAEQSAPDLAGEACFALAVDPTNRENVIAATTAGLYRRAGGTWNRLKEGVFSSVVVSSGAGTTRFYCAQWGQNGSTSGVFYSDNAGVTWTAAGSSFPTNDAGRIALGVQPKSPGVVYALTAKQSNGTMHGLYRLDAVAAKWKSVSGLPVVLPVADGESQGSYDLAIAVDPADVNLVYLGGSYVEPDPFPASIWRCAVKPAGSAYNVSQSASIGTHAHADVHSLTHTPDDSDELWCTCDGGVFLNRAPRQNGQFASQNNGLSCLCSNFLGQHPTDPNILFTGLQDNGTARTGAGPTWTHVMGGDGGYCVVNWANPNEVLVYANGTVYRSSDGGKTGDGWSPVWNFGWATMTQPVVTPRYNPASPGDADLVAVGAGLDIYVSHDFAGTWPDKFTLPGDDSTGAAYALAFASPTRLYIGTSAGQVFRADSLAGAWQVSRVDDVGTGPLGLSGLIADVAVDWSDPTLASVYVCFGGMGDARRVWRFDGTRWQDRSGSGGANRLLDIEHNALAVDPAHANSVYVGTDIGVWFSSNGGLDWSPVENGLPDAPVFDLQIHPTQRLLRAALHGRGVYELALA